MPKDEQSRDAVCKSGPCSPTLCGISFWLLWRMFVTEEEKYIRMITVFLGLLCQLGEIWGKNETYRVFAFLYYFLFPNPEELQHSHLLQLMQQWINAYPDNIPQTD